MSAPDLRYASRTEAAYRASWTGARDGLEAAQRRILEAARELEGWLRDDDTRKLVEIAYFSGDLILDVGTWKGRSCVVELLGARAAPQRTEWPRLVGVDVTAEALDDTYLTLARQGLALDAALFGGTLAELVQQRHAIAPTMAFLDADHRYEGVRDDLAALGGLLAPGVPLFAHDYTNAENARGAYGVRRALAEWESAGYGEFCGVFGCGALYVTTARCTGGAVDVVPGPLPAATFASLRTRIQSRHPFARRLAAEGFAAVGGGRQPLAFALGSSHGEERFFFRDAPNTVQWIRSPAILLLDNTRPPCAAQLRLTLGSDGTRRTLELEVNGRTVAPAFEVHQQLWLGEAAEVSWRFDLAGGDNVLRLLADPPSGTLPDGREAAFLVLGAPALELL